MELAHKPALPVERSAKAAKVALLVETSHGFGRSFLRGVAHYARCHGPWRLYITAGDFAQVLPEMGPWDGSGIIARIANDRVAQAIIDSRPATIALGLTN